MQVTRIGTNLKAHVYEVWVLFFGFFPFNRVEIFVKEFYS